MRRAGNNPRIAGRIEIIDEKGTAFLNCIHGNGRIARLAADTAKGSRISRVAFSADYLPIRQTTPKISTRSLEERPTQRAKRLNQLAGIGVLQSRTGEFEQKPLKCLIRLRQIAGTRVSERGIQWSPIAS